MRQMVLLFLSLFLSFKAYALDSIKYYIKEYPEPGAGQGDAGLA